VARPPWMRATEQEGRRQLSRGMGLRLRGDLRAEEHPPGMLREDCQALDDFESALRIVADVYAAQFGGAADVGKR
jgi:hypothetical protein